MDDEIFQNSLCITSMKQKLSGPIEAHGPFIFGAIKLKQNGCLDGTNYINVVQAIVSRFDVQVI